MTRRGKRAPAPKAPWLQTDAPKAEAKAEGKAPASPAKVDDDVIADTMAMAGGLIMSVFGRSKKNGRGKLDTALVDIQVLGIADKARKALDAGLAVELIVEKVAGDGCRCPHCKADVKDVVDKTVTGTMQGRPDLDEYAARYKRREAWRDLHCDPECQGVWGTGCPGCHGAIPEDFHP